MPESLGAEEFASRFEEVYQSLWCIAAAVLGHRSGVEDVLQDAAVTGLRKLEDFTPGTEFGAWMGQIVRFTARNHGRARQRRRAVSLEASGADSQPGPASEREAVAVGIAGSIVPGQDHFDDAVVGALNTLDEIARACLLMRTVLGKSYAEIAATLEIPEGTAMSHVHRARKRMRAALTEGSAT